MDDPESLAAASPRIHCFTLDLSFADATPDEVEELLKSPSFSYSKLEELFPLPAAAPLAENARSRGVFETFAPLPAVATVTGERTETRSESEIVRDAVKFSMSWYSYIRGQVFKILKHVRQRQARWVVGEEGSIAKRKHWVAMQFKISSLKCCCEEYERLAESVRRSFPDSISATKDDFIAALEREVLILEQFIQPDFRARRHARTAKEIVALIGSLNNVKFVCGLAL